MRIGLIGAGNMATALTRGWRRAGRSDELVVSDVDRERAGRLANEAGAAVVESNAEVAASADLVVLCHKPAQLEDVAAELADVPALASILWGVTVAQLESAYPDVPIYRFMPNIPAEVGEGVFCYSPGPLAARGPEAEVLELFGSAGTVITLDEEHIDPAGAISACGPAFFALMAEAFAEAAERRGVGHDDALRIATETMAGTAAVLRESRYDAEALRARVATPGGVTAKGLEALEEAAAREAAEAAVEAVVEEKS